MSEHDELGRTAGLPLTEAQREELLARQARLDEARAAADAAQHERDTYVVVLDDEGVAPAETATALGVLRVSVEHVLAEHRGAATAERLAAEVPRAAARSALDRAQDRVDQAWDGPAE